MDTRLTLHPWGVTVCLPTHHDCALWCIHNSYVCIHDGSYVHGIQGDHRLTTRGNKRGG